jgi:hypothetical protein
LNFFIEESVEKILNDLHGTSQIENSKLNNKKEDEHLEKEREIGGA